MRNLRNAHLFNLFMHGFLELRTTIPTSLALKYILAIVSHATGYDLFGFLTSRLTGPILANLWVLLVYARNGPKIK